MFNPQPITIQNYKTKQDFILAPLTREDKDLDQLIQDIYTCCSEDLIYKTLFQKRHPNGYRLDNAKDFLKYSEVGWKDQTHFIFGIFQPQTKKLVGAIDIKSSNKEKAEVGYWLSCKYSGLMTNALIALTKLAQEAQYKSLKIITDTQNQKSEAVVQRAGFTSQDTREKDGVIERIHILTL
jgi:RimJ/RimL family protein N-acetyltransferase